MRSLLLLVLLGWAGSYAGSPDEAAPRPENGGIHTPGRHDEAALVAAEGAGPLTLASEGRRWQPQLFTTAHPFSSVALRVPGLHAVVSELFDRRHDHAYQLFTLARPHAPRAPPLARS